MPKEPLPPPPPPPPTASEHFLRLLTRLGRFGWDFAGLFFLALALMTLLGLLMPQLASGLLSWWAVKLNLWLGWGSYWFVLGCGLFGLWLFRHNPERPTTGRFWLRVLAIEAAALGLAGSALRAGRRFRRACRCQPGWWSGRLGSGPPAAACFAAGWTGWSALAGVCLSAFLLVVLFAGLGLSRWTGWLGRRFRHILAVDGAPATRYVEPSPVVSEGPLQSAASAAPPGAQARRKLPVLPPQFRKSFRLQPDDSAPYRRAAAARRAPPRSRPAGQRAVQPS